MKNICLYFQVHHPFHLKTFRFFDVEKSKTWYDYVRNEMEIKESVTNNYIPTKLVILLPKPDIRQF